MTKLFFWGASKVAVVAFTMAVRALMFVLFSGPLFCLSGFDGLSRLSPLFYVATENIQVGVV